MPVVLTGYRALITKTKLEAGVKYPSLSVTVTVAAGRQLNGLAATRAARAKIVI